MYPTLDKMCSTENIYLADNVFVCEANNKPVLLGVVLVFLLDNKSFSGIVICSSLCE